MYRRSFEYQRAGIPEEYCGWAAESREESKSEAPCEEKGELLPAPCSCVAQNELSDYLIIGAVILLVLTKGKTQKPDIALLIGLAFLLFYK